MDLEAQLVYWTKIHDAEIEKLTNLDDNTDLDEIFDDKYLMAEYEQEKEKIETAILEAENKIEEINDKIEQELAGE